MDVLACDDIHEDGLALLRDAGSQGLTGVDALLVRSATGASILETL
jgi:hypothetical protein